MKRIIFTALALALSAPAHAQVTKSTEVTHQVMPDGTIFTETVTVLKEGGVEISRGAPHRVPHEPGAAIPPTSVGAAIAGAIWTPKVKKDFKDKRDAAKITPPQ